MPARRKPYTIYQDNIETQKDPVSPRKTQYRVRFTYYDTDGKRKQGRSDWSSSKTKAIQNATAKAKTIVNEATASELEAKKMTVKDLATHYLDYIQNRPLNEKYRATSQANDYSRTNCLVFGSKEAPSRTPTYILHKAVSELNQEDIFEWVSKINTTVSYKTKDHLNKITFDKYMTALRKLLKYGLALNCYYEKKDFLILKSATLVNDFIDTEIFTESKDRKLRVINEEQFRKMMITKRFPEGYFTWKDFLGKLPKISIAGEPKTAPPFDRALKNHMLLGMFFYSGMRASEIRALRWSDIEFVHESDPLTSVVEIAKVSVDKAYSYKSLKGKRDEHKAKDRFLKTKQSKRIIPIFGYYVHELYLYKGHFQQVYLYECKDTPIDEYINNMLLFPGKELDSYMTDSPIDRLIESAIKKIGIDSFTKHDFRRSRIKEFMLDGYTPEQIHRFFGHKDSKMILDVYNTLKDEEEYKVLSQAFNHEAFGAKTQRKHMRERAEAFFPSYYWETATETNQNSDTVDYEDYFDE